MEKLKNKWGTIVLFLLPGLFLYTGWVLYPIVQGIVLSTYRWTTISKKVFVGIENYIDIFNDKYFWISLKNTLWFMLGTGVFQITTGFMLGYLLYLQLKAYRFFKTVYFMPTVLMTVAVGFIWGYIYSPAFGLLKPFMEMIGLGQYYFPPLADKKTALFFLIIAQAWHSSGIQIMLFHAGFMNMPEEVIEMASIDGASGWKMMYHMIIPLSWGVAKTVIILQLTGALRVFDLVFIMTGGGPNHATEVLPMYMFAQAFQKFKIGHGSVVAVAIFILSMSLTMILRKIMGKEDLQY